MASSNISKEQNPIFKMKPFSEFTKKHAFVKIEPKSRKSPIEDFVKRTHEEHDRESAKVFVHDSYANAVKFGELSDQESSEKTEEYQEPKEKTLQKVNSEIDKEAEESVPAITQRRNNSSDIDLEKKKEHELPTMDYERESVVEQEYKWEKDHGMIPNSEKKPDLFDLHEIIKYIDQHRNTLEYGLSEADKKRLRVVKEATKDFKTICEDTIHHFRDDLVDFYQKIKKKFADALSEISDQNENQLENETFFI
ncbi:hypothetical protein BpHYR1_021063 [Brachionus plicatilis]|uniref:Uncharacterized protein n=1 Tax=Brachionus plicatilis TaxID=10195 RepID=A0A3M7PEC5_BRAPC|nr:hypothetical protein BpHYR1_021063 [Brachionus plicatilis]